MGLPVYILTLPNASRAGHLLGALAREGISYQTVDGIDGRFGLPAQYESQIDRAAAQRHLGRAMSDGEFACALSHLSIYRQFLETDAEAAVILEDDAQIGADFAEVYNALNMPACDLLFLDHRRTYVNPGRQISLTGGFSAYKIALPPFLANGYVISRRGAKHILANALPIKRPADWPCDLSDLDAYACHPRVVHHLSKAASGSTLEAGRRVRTSGRFHRFLSRAYWRRWWGKRRSVQIA